MPSEKKFGYVAVRLDDIGCSSAPYVGKDPVTGAAWDGIVIKFDSETIAKLCEKIGIMLDTLERQHCSIPTIPSQEIMNRRSINLKERGHPLKESSQ